MNEKNVAQRLEHVQQRIIQACERSGRNPETITRVAVTKTYSLETIRPFLEAGVHHVGENRVQEAFSKYANAAGLKEIPTNPTLHLIGQLQSNKAKKAVQLFDWIQSLDSESIAHDINRHAAAIGKTIFCLVQIKISDEPTKSGMAPESLGSFMQKASQWTFLKIRGLMGVAPYFDNPEQARPYFSKLRELMKISSTFDTLSMGMSHDFDVAIEEGATMIRIGTALFGARS